jgi:hypothetical protein
MPGLMRPHDLVAGLAHFPGRASGTDAERRAARWLAEVLRAGGREADLQTLWVRPQWPLVLALHAALGVAGSLVAVSEPPLGLALAAAALISYVLDALGWVDLLRRATPSRATQNVISPAPARGGRERIVRLVIVAHYDAGRAGLVWREGMRRAAGRVSGLAGGRLPGPATLVVLALALVVGIAGARLGGYEPGWLGLAQLVPTAMLLAALAVAIDVSLSGPVPAANDPASGAAVAIALAQALDRDPPRRLGVEVVLAGAGDGPSLGMRGYVSARRRRWPAEATAVLHLAACGRGSPRWWTSDGPLVPLRLHPRLAALAAQVAQEERHLHAAPRRGRGSGAGWRARVAGWPAITVGCRDEGAWPPGSHRHDDVAEHVDPAALRATLELCLALVAALDDDLAQSRPASSTK